MSTFAADFKVGYVPVTFPRDPVKFNLYEEHLYLGQILRPLIETDKTGAIVPGIASSWVISGDGKKIVFKISDAHFQSGKKVTAKDVKYTLLRHISLKSQSAEYLSSIEELVIKNDSEIEFRLKENDVTLMKVLTRDQLGIVPENWSFDTSKKEPFDSTGDFLLKNENQKWFLINRTDEKVKFELVFYTDEKNSLPKVIPDIIPTITESTLNQNLAVRKLLGNNLHKATSYGQTLFWIHKKSTLYSSESNRHCIAKILSKTIDAYVKTEGLEAATGVIPIGISGSSTEKIPVRFDKLLNCEKVAKKIKIFYLKSAHAHFIESSLIEKELKNVGFIGEFIPYAPSLNIEKMFSEADIIMTSIAGGFNDPSGFLGVLSKSFGMAIDTYFPADINQYLKDARSEKDTRKRIELYDSLNRKAVEKAYCIPGWKTPVYKYNSEKFTEEEVIYRYTPRLINYVRTYFTSSR